MQEHGVPVTYAYISDAHDLHPPNPVTNGYDHIRLRDPVRRATSPQFAGVRPGLRHLLRSSRIGRHPRRNNTLFVFSE